MINSIILKTSRVIAVILLIAIFSIAGIVACRGNSATNPSESGPALIPDPEKTGPITPGTNTDNPGDTNTDPEEPKDYDTNIPSWDDWNYGPNPPGGSSNPEPTPEPEPPKPTFHEDTYYKVYTPWRGENYPSVSYQDTNTLLKYWQEMISRKGMNDGRRWFIRDGDWDYCSNPKEVHHYYFDKNFDLVYHRLGKGTLKIRKLVGAVIVKYYRGKSAGTYTVAGLYENLIENAGQYNWTQFSKFMHAGYNPNNDKREVGDLELLVMNIGFNDQNFDRFGVDSYYNVWNRGGWRDNIEYFLGRDPDFVDNQDPQNYALNQKVNLTYNPGAHNFWFMTATPEAWHLEEHPEGDWISR